MWSDHRFRATEYSSPYTLVLTEGRQSLLDLDGRGKTDVGGDCALHTLFEMKLTYSTGQL